MIDLSRFLSFDFLPYLIGAIVVYGCFSLIGVFLNR